MSYFSKYPNDNKSYNKRRAYQNTTVVAEKRSKQTSYNDEERRFDMNCSYTDDNDESSTVEEPEDEQFSASGTSQQPLTHNTASVFRNVSAERQKCEANANFNLHGHMGQSLNLTGGRTFGEPMCHHHPQQMGYGIHGPSTSLCVMPYSNTTPATSYAIYSSTPTPISNDISPVQSDSARRPLSAPRAMCNFGLNRMACAGFGQSFHSVYNVPNSVASLETFCSVPGRTSLLSSATKYHVTIGEIYRRISPPECLNASLLGGILRKAKSKDGGKTLRDSLKRVGLTLPAGRRKAATVTAWTALVEEEALQMAKDFAVLCEKAFPVQYLAEYMCNRIMWRESMHDSRSLVEYCRDLVRELLELINGDRCMPSTIAQQNPLIAPTMQNGLTHFSLLTHGFGPLAFITVLNTVVTMLDEMLKCYERNDEHLTVPLSVISVAHIPSNRVLYNM